MTYDTKKLFLKTFHPAWYIGVNYWERYPYDSTSFLPSITYKFRVGIQLTVSYLLCRNHVAFFRIEPFPPLKIGQERAYILSALQIYYEERVTICTFYDRGK